MSGEQIAGLLLSGVVMMPVWILGAVLCCGRGAGLIAGYNTAPEEEKQRYNPKRLCRVTGGGMAVLTVLLAVMAAFQDTLPAEFAGVFAGAAVLVSVGIVILCNTVCRRR